MTKDHPVAPTRRSALKTIFHIDHLFVAAFALGEIALLLSIIHALHFLDPVEKVVKSMSMADIYYRINNTGTLQTSRDITLVDITDLSERKRDSIAMVISDVRNMQPDVVGVDVIFERELINVEADNLLTEVFYEAATDSSTVIAMKLTEPDSRKGLFHNSLHSFFTERLMDRHITEGATNVIVEPDRSINQYPVYLQLDGQRIYSLPALMARAVTGRDVKPNKDTEHSINYRGIRFPVVDYRQLADSAHLIRGHKVLIGSTREEVDKHLTPVGLRSGLEVLAFALNSMIEGSHVWVGSLFWKILAALLAGIIMNIIDFYITRPIDQSGHLMSFLTKSKLYAKVIAFVWMVVFTGITYNLYTMCDVYVNTWLALGTIALTGDGRLIYKSLLTVIYNKRGSKAIDFSIYNNDIQKK